MQDFFFVGIISAIALGVLLFKSILFFIHLRGAKADQAIIERNLARNKEAQQQAQQLQKTMSSIENVVDWRIDDPRFVTDELRQQYSARIKTRRTPNSDRASPMERVPLATTDFGEDSDNEPIHEVPIYTYSPSIGGTQV